MSLTSQEVPGVVPPSSMPWDPETRRLDRQRRRQQARWLTSVLWALGIAFIGHQLVRPPAPSRMEQVAGKLLPAAQAEPSGKAEPKSASR